MVTLFYLLKIFIDNENKLDMGPYFKKFENHSQYEAFTGTTDFILPNVSKCVREHDVHYNPYVKPETRVVAKFNVTDTSSPTPIGYNQYMSGFSEIEIDGVVQPSVVSAYTFTTTGEHTVKYTLKSPTSIGIGAFQSCSNLTSIVIPSGVTYIGSNAFLRCSSLTSINIPNGVTFIGDSAFQYCSGLTSIDIPNSVTSIGGNAFLSCRSLTSIDIPSGVTIIRSGTFSYCYSLTSIDIPSGVTSIVNDAFQYCTSITSCTIGSGVTSIGGNAFQNCSGLISCTIPSGVTFIGETAFWNCRSLTSVTVNATTPPTLGSNVFASTNNCPIYVPCDSVSTYKAASGWSTYASRIEGFGCPLVLTAKFNVTSTTYSTRIASGTSSFTKIEIDGVEQPSVTTGYTFSTPGEHTVKYYLNNTSIGNEAFYGCTGLTSCTIGSGVTTIGNYAFRYCESLTSIDIPDSVTSIGSSAFYYCTGLTSINIPSGVTSIGNYAFSYCDRLRSIAIPSSVTSIGQGAFEGCYSLTSINIPSGVTSIGTYTFLYCYSLTSINIPSGVTSIGNGAFQDCSGVTSITVNATTPPTLGSDVFTNTNNCSIYVPSTSVETYKSASSWSSYSSRIQAIP